MSLRMQFKSKLFEALGALPRTPIFKPQCEYPNGILQGPMTEYLLPAEEWDTYPHPPPDYEPLDKYLKRVKKKKPFKKGIPEIPEKECICMKRSELETKELQDLLKRQKDNRKISMYKKEICNIGQKFGVPLEEEKLTVTLPKDWVYPQTTYGAAYRIPTFRDVVKPFIRTKDSLTVNEIEIKTRKLRTPDSEYTEKIGKLGNIIIEYKMHGELASFPKSLNCFEILQRKLKTSLV